MLEIKDLTIEVDNKVILDNFNLTIKNNEIHTIMGLNGTGKSTICKTIMGDPKYKVINGTILFNNEDLLKMDITTRARKGIFLLNQNPIEIEGVTNSEMLKVALESKLQNHVSIFEFSKLMNNVCEKLNIPKEFIHRGINESMSGGEKKKNELLHLYILEPSFIMLDELDSGLDIDNLNTLSYSLKQYFEEKECSILIITHHTNILKYLKPNYVHILESGKIKTTGDNTLAENIEKNGFVGQ